MTWTDTTETLFDDTLGVQIVRVTRKWSFNYSRGFLNLLVNARPVAGSSNTTLKGSPEAWVRARLKARINYVNRKIAELRRFEEEHDRLSEAYERYRK
jgi:hypothetical protein